MDLENGNSNGMMEVEEGREDEEMMDLDDMPVTQEDAWAVIRYGRVMQQCINTYFFVKDRTPCRKRKHKNNDAHTQSEHAEYFSKTDDLSSCFSLYQL